MREDTFESALRSYSRAVPFYPFTIELHNRVRLISRHPEAVRIDALGTAVLVELDGNTQHFDAASVVRLVSVVIPPGAE